MLYVAGTRTLAETLKRQLNTTQRGTIKVLHLGGHGAHVTNVSTNRERLSSAHPVPSLSCPPVVVCTFKVVVVTVLHTCRLSAWVHVSKRGLSCTTARQAQALASVLHPRVGHNRSAAQRSDQHTRTPPQLRGEQNATRSTDAFESDSGTQTNAQSTQTDSSNRTCEDDVDSDSVSPVTEQISMPRPSAEVHSECLIDVARRARRRANHLVDLRNAAGC